MEFIAVYRCQKCNHIWRQPPRSDAECPECHWELLEWLNWEEINKRLYEECFDKKLNRWR